MVKINPMEGANMRKKDMVKTTPTFLWKRLHTNFFLSIHMNRKLLDHVLCLDPCPLLNTKNRNARIH